jgi:quinol monooxygenase YgiN
VSCRHVVITFRVVPDRRKEFLERLHHVVAEMKSEPAYYEAILRRDPLCENVFMLYETWEVTMTLLMSN